MLYKFKDYDRFYALLKKNNYSFFIFSLTSKKQYLNVLNDYVFHVKYLNNIFFNFKFTGEMYIYLYNPIELTSNLNNFQKLCLEKE